ARAPPPGARPRRPPGRGARARRVSPEDRLSQLSDRALALGIVGERLADRDLARAARRHTALHELGGIDEEPRADPLLEPARLQMPHLLAELRQLERDLHRRAALVRDHLRLAVARRIVELDGDEALPGRVLQVLQHALVARV